MHLPSSTPFFQGQADAESGMSMPKQPSFYSTYDEKMYFRGFVQQLRRMKVSEPQRYCADELALAS